MEISLLVTHSLYLPLFSHHVTLPGAATTPEVGFYEVATLTIDCAKHHLVAASMEQYTKAITDKVFNYLSVAVSEDDPEQLVIIMGYPDPATAAYADKVRDTRSCGEVSLFQHFTKSVSIERRAHGGKEG